MAVPSSRLAVHFLLSLLLVLLGGASCDGDDEGAGGGGPGGGEGVGEANQHLLVCRAPSLTAAYNPATGSGNGDVENLSPYGRFAVPSAVTATNPHPSSEVRILFYPVGAAYDTCNYRCTVSGGVCASTTMTLQSCTSGTRSAGDVVPVSSLKYFVSAWSTVPSTHGGISSAWTPTEAGPCPNPCADPNNPVDDGDACTLDRCAAVGGSFAPVHTDVCGAGAIEPGVATSVGDALFELLAGPNPVQHAPDPSALDLARAAGITGQVMLPGGTSPAEGIRVSIADHPELGWTETDASGSYVMLVEAGGELTVEIGSRGYLQLHRSVPTRAQSWTTVETVELTEASLNATRVVLDGSTTLSTVVGDLVSDPACSSGTTCVSSTRRPNLVVPATAGARLVTNGVAGPSLPALTLRMTEYTVGLGGLAKMPATLPAATAYTYAIEISADEAEAAGADGVEFDVPIVFYVDNFVDIPVGGAVPSGRYDATQRRWVPGRDGKVISILSFGLGRANVDTDGDGLSDNSGLSSSERNKLFSLYSSGSVPKELWRVELDHLSAHDLNYGRIRPADACDAGACDDDPDPVRNLAATSDSTCSQLGSIIECDNQILGERLPVTGTGMTLDYRSDRVPGNAASRKLEVPVTESFVPGSMTAAVVGLDVAGERLEYRYACPALGDCLPNRRHTFTWDGKDRFGRFVFGRQLAGFTWRYEYPVQYGFPTNGGGRSFGGGAGGGPAGASFVRVAEWTPPYRAQVPLGSWDARSWGLGGWSLSAVHAFDPISRVVFYGDGTRRSVENAVPRITTAPFPGGVSGGVLVAYRKNGDLLRAKGSTVLKLPMNATSTTALPTVPQTVVGITVSADDALYVRTTNRIYRFDDAGQTWLTIAGTGTTGEPACAGESALSAPLPNLGAVAAGDGNVYFTKGSHYGTAICRVAPDGRLYRVAGTPNSPGTSGDGSAAINASLRNTTSMAAGPDGSLYVVNDDDYAARVRRIDREGIIRPFAGGGSSSQAVSGVATQVTLGRVRGVAAGADGSVFITQETQGVDWAGHVNKAPVLRVVKDGVMSTIAGAHAPSNCEASLQTSGYEYCGSGGKVTNGDATAVSGPAGDVRFRQLASVAVGPDGTVALGQYQFVALLRSAIPGQSVTETRVPSEDGSVVDVFDARGLHVRTEDALTGLTLATITHDELNRVQSISDRDGRTTTIDRPTASTTSISGPYGHTTVLTLTSGWTTRVTNPAGEAYDLTYGAGGTGLLASFKSPRNAAATTFTYDTDGRLIRDRNADTSAALRNISLSRATIEDGHSIEITSPLGRVSEHDVEWHDDGTFVRRATHPDGTTSTATRTPDGRTTVELPDGTLITESEAADPLWGTLRPYVARRDVALPGLGTRSVVVRRTLSPANATPTTYTSMTEEIFIDPVMSNNLPTGQPFTRSFVRATNVETWTTPLGRTFTRTLDAKGRTVSFAPPGVSSIGLAYDADGRLRTTTQGSRSADRTYRAGDGLLETTTDPADNTTSYDWDSATRLLSVTRPVVGATSVTYELDGLLESVIPPGRSAHAFAHTPTDLVSSYTPPTPTTGATAYEYDEDGALERLTLPSGTILDLVHDDSGRLDEIFASSTRRLLYDHDASTGALTDLKGPTYSSGTPQTVLHRTFAGPLVTAEQTTGAAQPGATVTLDYGNEPTFRVHGETVAGSPSVVYTYDADGLLTGAGPLTIERDPATGRISKTCVGGAAPCDQAETTEIVETRTYDATYGGLATLSYERNQVVLFSANYTHDDLGRIDVLDESICATTASPCLQAELVDTVYDYTYDDAGRLTDVSRDGVLEEHYVYDANGNRTSTTNDAVSSEPATFDGQDRITTYGSHTIVHDANGDVTSRTGGAAPLTVSRDLFGHLLTASASGGSTSTYVVDALGRPRKKTIGGVFKGAWVWRDELAPVAELSSTGAVTKRFIYGTSANVPDVVTTPGTSPVETWRLVKDHLGSVRLVVRTSDGLVLRRMDFDSYGRRVIDAAASGYTSAVVPFGFAGGFWDADTDLIRFGAREYDPQTGRWLSKDPIGFLGGDTNLYVYAGNDPINYRDPTGTTVRGQRNPLLEWLGEQADLYFEIGGWNWDQGNYASASALYAFGGLVNLVPLAASGLTSAAICTVANAPANGTFYVDRKGNVIPTPPGGGIKGSPDGRFIQAVDGAGRPTGVRIDGGHNPRTHSDPRALNPHGHVPGLKNPDGTPWLPLRD